MPATIPATAPVDRPVDFDVDPDVRNGALSALTVLSFAGTRCGDGHERVAFWHGVEEQQPRNGGTLAMQVYQSPSVPAQLWAGMSL